MPSKSRPGNGTMESAILRAAREIEARHETIDSQDDQAEWFTPRMIADRTNRDPMTVHRELKRMAKEGLLESTRKRVKYDDRVVQAQVYRWAE
jgi:DNA-binding MarR family transcriptional regulator